MAVVERDRIAGADEVLFDGDHPAGEEALVELPGAARDVHGAVLAHAAAEVLQEGGGERGLVEGAAAGAGPRLGRRLANEPAVRGAMVVIGHEGIEAHLHVVERGQVPEMVEASSAQRAPESLHLSSGGGIARARMEQGDAETFARETQSFAAVRGAVIEVEPVGRAMAAKRGEEHLQHVDLALGVTGFDGHEEARGIVEERVDAQRPGGGADA